jgi:hypothetical protein
MALRRQKKRFIAAMLVMAAAINVENCQGDILTRETLDNNPCIPSVRNAFAMRFQICSICRRPS